MGSRSRSDGGVTADGLVASSAPRCPQWWQAFRVIGRRADIYTVYADDIVHDTMRCTCPALRQDTCWHIQCVMRHGCFAGPDREAGLNDLTAFGVEVLALEQHPQPRLAQRLRQRCACGEPLQLPNLRLTDDEDRQLVRVVFADSKTEYGYAWDGAQALRVGGAVTVGENGYATVVDFGSDWAGSLTVVRQMPLRR